jgi:hypothetical protein
MLGEILIEKGLLTRDLLDELLDHQAAERANVKPAGN